MHSILLIIELNRKRRQLVIWKVQNEGLIRIRSAVTAVQNEGLIRIRSAVTAV